MVSGLEPGVGWLLPGCQYSWHSFASNLLYSFGDRTYLCVHVPGWWGGTAVSLPLPLTAAGNRGQTGALLRVLNLTNTRF